MIICNKCLVPKGRSEFFTRAGGKHKTPCKVCIFERNRNYIETNRNHVRAVQRAYRSKQRQELLGWIQGIKTSTGCIDCGYSACPIALHFDHVSGEKLGCVSTMAHNGFSKETILEEISKCQVRCVVCHRLKTHVKTDSIMTEQRTALREAKTSPCLDCGGVFPSCAMDFDHIDASTKVACISTMVSENWPVPTILLEIGKCRLLCANCHAVRTHKEVA